MIGYTTIEDVIQEAGFKNNSNVDAANVKLQIEGAEGVVNGSLGDKYSMPFPFRYRNSVIFKGDVASDIVDIVITINSVAYTVTPVVGMTLSKIADLFRIELETPTDLTVDIGTDLEGNHKVFFTGHSLVAATSLLEVDVTSLGTNPVSGITMVEGGPEKRYPYILDLITRKLAAAMLLGRSYGKNSKGSDNEGGAKWNEAMGLLKKILNGEIKINDDLGGTGEITRNTSKILPKVQVTKANTALDEGDEDATPRRFHIRKGF